MKNGCFSYILFEPKKLKTMKKSIIAIATILCLTVLFVSCKEEPKTEAQKQMEAMKAEGAEVKIKKDEDETKIKVETDDKELKIKKEEGDTVKVKVEDDSK